MADETASSVRQWDDQVDQFITSIDAITTSEAGISLREMLTHPEKYLSDKDAAKKLDAVKAIVFTYFGNLTDSMKDEKEKLRSELESAGVQYISINNAIMDKAAGLKIPYIKPVLVDLNTDLKEEVVIEQYNDTIDALIGKFIAESTYVADLSGTYKGHTLGSWLFSTSKPLVLTIRPPEGLLIFVERANEAITSMLESLVPMA